MLPNVLTVRMMSVFLFPFPGSEIVDKGQHVFPFSFKIPNRYVLSSFNAIFDDFKD